MAEQTLGHNSHIDRTQDIHLFANEAELRDALEEVSKIIVPAFQRNLKLVEAVRQAENPGAPQIQHWDLPYWVQRSQQRLFGVKKADLNQYLPQLHLQRALVESLAKALELEVKTLTDFEDWGTPIHRYALHHADSGVEFELWLDVHARPGKLARPVNTMQLHGRDGQPLRFSVLMSWAGSNSRDRSQDLMWTRAKPRPETSLNKTSKPSPLPTPSCWDRTGWVPALSTACTRLH